MTASGKDFQGTDPTGRVRGPISCESMRLLFTLAETFNVPGRGRTGIPEAFRRTVAAGGDALRKGQEDVPAGTEAWSVEKLPAAHLSGNAV